MASLVIINMYLLILKSVPNKTVHCEQCTAAISYKSLFFSPSFQGPLKATWKYILAASNAVLCIFKSLLQLLSLLFLRLEEKSFIFEKHFFYVRNPVFMKSPFFVCAVSKQITLFFAIKTFLVCGQPHIGS